MLPPFLSREGVNYYYYYYILQGFLYPHLPTYREVLQLSKKPWYEMKCLELPHLDTHHFREE